MIFLKRSIDGRADPVFLIGTRDEADSSSIRRGAGMTGSKWF